LAVKLSDEDIAMIVCIRAAAMATNFGTKTAINWLCVNDIDYAIAYEGGLSGQPTECRYCQYPVSKEHCYGNHFLAFDEL